MLRIATLEDADLVMEMGLKFIETTPYKTLYTKERLKAVVDEYIASGGENGRLVLLYENKGMILGLAYPFAFGDVLQCTEVAWWVEPEFRKEGVGDLLLEGLEYWAKKVGCSIMTMVSLDDKLEQFYAKKGYRLSERIHMKDL